MAGKSQALHLDLSIVIPIYDERGTILALHKRLTDTLASMVHLAYKIIFVDDGSSDGSAQVCQQLVETDPHVTLVKMRCNFGKAIALQAGFQTARGEIIITLDGDLQDEPAEIPRFLEAIEEGFDLVSGWKMNRQDPLSKTLPSRFFNRVTAWLTGIPLHDFNCGFKAYRRELVKNIDLYGELHRYIPVLARAKGFRIGEIPVQHHPRKYGQSKYSFERFLRGAFDLLTVLFLSGYQRRPLHLFGMIGFLIFLVGSLIDFYLVILWFLGQGPIGNRPLLTLGTLLILTGIQLFVFGLLAEMLSAVSYRRTEVNELTAGVFRGRAGTNTE